MVKYGEPFYIYLLILILFSFKKMHSSLVGWIDLNDFIKNFESKLFEFFIWKLNIFNTLKSIFEIN